MYNDDLPPKKGSKAQSRRTRQLNVLIVDDETDSLTRIQSLLETFHMRVLIAQSTTEALDRIGASNVDVALIDWHLGSADDGMALGRHLYRDRDVPFVLFSGYLTTEIVAHAMRQGAADVVDKPIEPGRLLAALEFATAPRPTESASMAVHCGSDPVSRRWARMVLLACRAKNDPDTEPAVASAAAVSTSTYRKTCAACNVGGRETRDLVRFLRAEARSKEDGSLLREHLCSLDPRTVDELFSRARLPVNTKFVQLKQFLLNQQFVPSTAKCFRELSHLAANDSLFFIEFN